MSLSESRRRGVVNDTPVRDAACRVLVEQGWGRFTIARVAADLGRSPRTVTERARTPSLLAADLAASVAGPQLVDRCADLVGAWLLGRAVAQPWPLEAALHRTADWQGTVPARVLAELVVVAHFDEEVRDSLVATVRAPLTALCAVPGGPGPGAALVAMAVGLALTSRSSRARLLRSAGAMSSYAHACTGAVDPVALPFLAADHMDREPRLDPDPVIDALLHRMLDSIGENGYDGTRVKDLAAAVGVSEGFVFNRFPTKSSLLATALALNDEAGYSLNEAYMNQLEADYGRGIASAVMMRESLRPGREVARGRVLELARMSWHEPDGRTAAEEVVDQLREDLLRQPGWADYETEAEFHLEIAQTVGVLTLPMLVDGAFDVPLDTVTVAWDRIRRERAGV